MTNHWIDMQHAKAILVESSNVAENHPMAYKWIRKAQENGAKLIPVDPRFTRTSAGADVYARIRPGTDAAFLNTMINHILVNRLYDEDFVTTHTNALFLIQADYDFKDGLFSGYDATKQAYDTKSWGYQLDSQGRPRRAARLDDPHCVFARLKTFVSRYTPEMGERITGVPAAQITDIAETMAKNRPGTILYALGMTQHTTGVQGIRAFTILQLLLGNLGKPGSGVNALRGEPNVQGACDMGVLNNYLPGYMDYPSHTEPTLAAWTRKNGTGDRRFLINMLKAFYGDAATAQNEFGYGWLPKKSAAKNYSRKAGVGPGRPSASVGGGDPGRGALRPTRCAPPRRGLAARGGDVRPSVSRPPSLPRLDRHVPVSRSARRCVRPVARRGAMASQLLPDLRVGAGHGSAHRRRPRTPAVSLLRRLPLAVALPPDPVPVLRERLAAARGPGGPGRSGSPDRLLRGVPGISEDLRRAGR
jgi:hypothetical protein